MNRTIDCLESISAHHKENFDFISPAQLRPDSTAQPNPEPSIPHLPGPTHSVTAKAAAGTHIGGIPAQPSPTRPDPARASPSHLFCPDRPAPVRPIRARLSRAQSGPGRPAHSDGRTADGHEHASHRRGQPASGDPLCGKRN